MSARMGSEALHVLHVKEIGERYQVFLKAVESTKLHNGVRLPKAELDFVYMGTDFEELPVGGTGTVVNVHSGSSVSVWHYRGGNHWYTANGHESPFPATKGGVRTYVEIPQLVFLGEKGILLPIDIEIVLPQ